MPLGDSLSECLRWWISHRVGTQNWDPLYTMSLYCLSVQTRRPTKQIETCQEHVIFYPENGVKCDLDLFSFKWDVLIYSISLNPALLSYKPSEARSYSSPKWLCISLSLPLFIHPSLSYSVTLAIIVIRLEMFHTANPLKQANSHSRIQIRFRPRVRVSVELVKRNKAAGFSPLGNLWKHSFLPSRLKPPLRYGSKWPLSATLVILAS